MSEDINVGAISEALNNKMDRDFNNHTTNIITLIPDLTQSVNITNDMVLDDYYFLVGSPVITDNSNNQFELFIDNIKVLGVGWSGASWSQGGAYSNLLIPNQTITINNSSYLGTLKLYKAKIHVATITS